MKTEGRHWGSTGRVNNPILCLFTSTLRTILPLTQTHFSSLEIHSLKVEKRPLPADTSKLHYQVHFGIHNGDQKSFFLIMETGKKTQGLRSGK